MEFTVKGTSYEIPEIDDLTTSELREVKNHTGMGLRPLSEGFQDMDPDAIMAVVFVAKSRAGEKINWSDLDDLKPLKDIEWPQVDEDGNVVTGDDGASAKPRPTKGRSTGNGHANGSRATSASSPTTSTSPPATSTTSP